MKPIRHINQLGTRVREQGRLRMGKKTGKAMAAIKHWRFTSPERDALEQLAAIYGGEVTPWSEPKASQGENQFQLFSEAQKIRVLVPPGGLSTWYELWSGGGVQRRCDGETVFIDGNEEKARPCLCVEQGRMTCKPKTRMSVVLPDVRPFGGVWRLDTGSWNAADELAAMEQMLDQMQVNGIVEAQLMIEERQRMVEGKKKKFVVPVLLISASADMAIGGEGLLAIQAPAEPMPLQIEAPKASDDIIDAEVVSDRGAMNDRLTMAMTLIAQMTEFQHDELELAFALGGSQGKKEDLDELTDAEVKKALAVAEQVAQGQKRIAGINDEGRMVLK